MTPNKHYEPEQPVRRPSSDNLIQLAGSSLNDQCINMFEKQQCGKRKRPNSSFCSPKCQSMHNRAHPDNKLT